MAQLLDTRFLDSYPHSLCPKKTFHGFKINFEKKIYKNKIKIIIKKRKKNKTINLLTALGIGGVDNFILAASGTMGKFKFIMS